MTTSARYFLLVILLISFALVAVLFAPYVSVIILTIVLGVIFQPVYAWFLRRKMPKWLSAGLTTLLIVIVIAGPVSFIVTQVVRQADGIITEINNEDTSRSIAKIEARIQKVFPATDIDIRSYVQSGLQFIVGSSGKIFGGIVGAGITFFLSIIGLFYWFIDSERLGQGILRASPMADADDRGILDTLSKFIHSVITGTLMVAIIQAIIAGIGFWIFGVPNAVLWASVVAVAALVPTIGTGIVIIPMVIYLALSGNIGYAIGLAVWGAVAVGTVDNIIGPKLMSRGSQVHPFFILLGVLGGVQLFGPIGLFAGPLLVAAFFALLEVYATRAKQSQIVV